MIRFLPDYAGDLMGLYNNENYLVYKWNKPDCKILFSICRQGKAMNCNFASDKKGLRKLKKAIDEFLDFVFKSFAWCVIILAEVKIKSVKRLVEKLGFKIFDGDKDFDFYCLTKEAYYG